MTKTSISSIILLLSSILAILFIVLGSEKISIDESGVISKESIGAENASSTESGASEIGTQEYLLQMEGLLKEIRAQYELQSQGPGDQLEAIKFSISALDEKSQEILVPKPYKDFHLLFSRALLRFSTHLASPQSDNGSEIGKMLGELEAEFIRLKE